MVSWSVSNPFFLSVWLHNAKSLQLKEISPAVDDGGPSEQLKQGVSTDLLRHPPNKIRKKTQGWAVNVAV